MMKAWKQKSLYLVILTIITALVLAGCTTTNNKNEGTPTNVAPTEQQPTNNGVESSNNEKLETSYPLTITDDTNTTLEITQVPQKVVTLLPSETEILYAIGSGEQVVGVDAFSNYPNEAKEKAQIGDSTTNIEAIMALEPDVVFASSTMNTAAIEQLRALDITVYATDPKTYEAVIEKIQAIGTLMNKQQEAEAVAKHMQSVKDDIVTKLSGVEPKTVFFEVMEGWTVGSGEFIDEMLQLAGGTNVAGQTPGWYEISVEQLIEMNPSVILFADREGETDVLTESIKNRAGWEVIDAIKEQKVFPINEDQVSRVGPRLADSLQHIAAALHPELFEQQ
ncbi:ABC transporter substrate-binding protein [Paenibacillus yanchengensis]|uniref:ABC transporter substrate-binding protein n=1 Tax=Paenibacillus yanchengensis TaxID=2035833 RepID=A0ABW4YMC3_9BACL